MEIIVGRKGQQPFEITDRSVSGKHLKLITMSDGNVLIEDLGLVMELSLMVLE